MDRKGKQELKLIPEEVLEILKILYEQKHKRTENIFDTIELTRTYHKIEKDLEKFNNLLKKEEFKF